MGIKMKPLQFDNLIVYKTNQHKSKWDEGVFAIEDFPLNREIYKSGPVFFSFSPEASGSEEGVFTYYLPINDSVNLNDETGFTFQNRFAVENALVLRQADEETNFTEAYQKIKDYADSNSIMIENTYYCVLLDVYGEYIIDLYVPIKEAGAA